MLHGTSTRTRKWRGSRSLCCRRGMQLSSPPHTILSPTPHGSMHVYSQANSVQTRLGLYESEEAGATHHPRQIRCSSCVWAPSMEVEPRDHLHAARHTIHVHGPLVSVTHRANMAFRSTRINESRMATLTLRSGCKGREPRRARGSSHVSMPLTHSSRCSYEMLKCSYETKREGFKHSHET